MRYLTRAAVAMAVAVGMLLSTTSAFAEPATGYGDFADCPDRTVDPTIGPCIVSTVTSGHLQMGTKDTPITDPIKLVGSQVQGGSGQFYVGSFDGGRQRIPGGVIGITGLDWLTFLFPGNLLQLYAESELAGTVGSPLDNSFPLPLKVHLDNPLLSNNCYIGSNANPIALNLNKYTTAPPPPNTPITGNPGTFGFDPATGIISISGLTLVDNAFAAPEADNCDLIPIGLIDAIVNLQAGLPSPAGTNETIQNGSAKLTGITLIFPPDGID